MKGTSKSAVRYAAAGCALLALLHVASAGYLGAQSGPALSEAEEDKLREAQDPSERIGVYLDLMQVRLDRFESFRHEPDNPKYDNAGYLDDLLGEYVTLNEELKNWIEYQYQHEGDMRRGLQKLLERGAQQLATLRGVKEAPDNYASRYADSLRDASDQLSDTLDGAAQALADQVKKFGELKREEKAAAQAAKERAKEEKKRSKEEKKLRKQQKKSRVPGESDDD
jgi:hypothetical protein